MKLIIWKNAYIIFFKILILYYIFNLKIQLRLLIRLDSLQDILIDMPCRARPIMSQTNSEFRDKFSLDGEINYKDPICFYYLYCI